MTGSRLTAGWWACAFAAASLMLGMLFVYPRQWTRGFLINDEAWYAEPARNIVQGRGFVTETLYPMFARQVESLPMNEPFKQIGYPLVAALLSRVTGVMNDQLFVAIAVAGFALTGMATWLAVSAIVRSRPAAAVITLATIGNPVFWAYWTAAAPESLFTALFLGGIWLLLRGSVQARLGAGVLLATSLYFKGYAILYLPLAAAFLWFGARPGRGRALGAFTTGVVGTVAFAAIFLPTGTRQLSSASGDYAGSMLLYEMRGAYASVEGPLYDISPVRPLPYIVSHPLSLGEKLARMATRTKSTMEELGGPAFGGILFPLLLFLGVAVSWDLANVVGRRKACRPEIIDQAHARPLRLFLAGLIAANLLFFWAGNFRARYFAHLFPLMLCAAVIEFDRLVPQARDWWRRAPKPLLATAIGYLLVLPPVVGLWHGYRDPYAYLGRMLAVRWVHYDQVTANVEANVPEDGMVMSDMAHEISWYTGRPTVFFPGAEDQVEYLIEKYDVRALYEHPQVTRNWPTLQRQFELADDRNGRFWVRRD